MLMLEVVSPHRTSMGSNARRFISDAEAAQFTIGRQSTCSWVFPQDYVSRHQATIRLVNGMCFLERTGSAPLAINDRSRPVERNRIVRLSPGDRILIDDIEILVSEAEPGAEVELSQGPIEPPPALHGTRDELPGGSGQTGDILALLNSEGGSATEAERARNLRRDEQLFPQNLSAIDAVVDFRDAGATAKSAKPSEVPDDRWWEDGSSVKPGIPDPGQGVRPVAAQASPRTLPGGSPAASTYRPPAPPRGDFSLDDVLRGAGLDPAQVSMSPEVAHQLGEVLRIVVAGTMEVLKARNDIRRELRLASTALAARENNPLKFSADVDDALHKLLIQRAAAYLGTVAAFQESFSDIRCHQIALLKSVGAAFDHMLAKFDPKSLEAELELSPGRSGVLGLVAKGKPWETYVKHYAELVGDREASYRRLFGEEWARSYEKELETQKRLARTSGGTS
jgi:type VI secretion system protein ImpI